MYNVFLIQFNAKQRYYSTEVQGLYNPEQTVENLNKFNELAAKTEMWDTIGKHRI